MKKMLFMLLLMMVVIIVPAMAQLDSEPAPETDTISEEHVPGAGITLVNNKFGKVAFNPYASLRYLNQLSTNSTYTDAFGRNINVQRRNDVELHKVVLYFKGWLFDPKFNYIFYGWTSNSNQGQGAQVVFAGSIQYQVNKHLRLGAGVLGLPTVRSLLMNFPNWLVQDARPMADEFFRGSFTMAVWAQGKIMDGLNYKTSLGNNLSILGVDAGQLDNGFDTWSSSVWWVTNNYGNLAPYSDFEKHCKPATVLGGAFTRSNETKQSQPGENAPENSQIRLSDGTGIFGLNALAPNSQVLEAKYEMASFYGGVKYRGFSLDLDYYMRWVSKFETIGTIPVTSLFDDGFTIQGAYMLIHKTLDVHAIYSYINGEYGKPWEFIGGFNWYPYKNRALRLNPEIRLTHHSPVGYLAFPTFVGSTGAIYVLNLELNY